MFETLKKNIYFVLSIVYPKKLAYFKKISEKIYQTPYLYNTELHWDLLDSDDIDIIINNRTLKLHPRLYEDYKVSQITIIDRDFSIKLEYYLEKYKNQNILIIGPLSK